MVAVPMMDVGEVGMAVDQRFVLVRMGMGLGAIPVEVVAMLVMFVVTVAVGMLHRLMRVFVAVPLGQVQP